MADTAHLRAELQHRLALLEGEGRARRLLRRAARLTGASTPEPTADDVLRICAALSVEGGAVQQLAEDIARSALDGATPT